MSCKQKACASHVLVDFTTFEDDTFCWELEVCGRKFTKLNQTTRTMGQLTPNPNMYKECKSLTKHLVNNFLLTTHPTQPKTSWIFHMWHIGLVTLSL